MIAGEEYDAARIPPPPTVALLLVTIQFVIVGEDCVPQTTPPPFTAEPFVMENPSSVE